MHNCTYFDEFLEVPVEHGLSKCLVSRVYSTHFRAESPDSSSMYCTPVSFVL